MKTIIFLLLPVSMMLQVTINAQTKSLMPSVKRNQNSSVTIAPVNTVTTTNSNAAIEMLASEVDQMEKTKQEINQKINDFFENDQKTSPLDALAVKNFSDQQLVEQFNSQANELFSRSNQLKKEAKFASVEHKKILYEQSKQFEEAAFLAMINAAYINASINNGVYANNKRELEKLMFDYTGYKFTYMVAIDKLKDAERYHRIGEELRNESLELKNNSAKLGSLQNAEEKDIQAIALQDEVKQMFVVVCQK